MKAFVSMALAGLLLFAVPAVSVAQVPPHVPGTVCMTPHFWCWAEEQGQVGDLCACYLLDDNLLEKFEGDVNQLSDEEFDQFYMLVNGVYG